MKKILVCLLTALIASGMFAATAPADSLPAFHVCKGKEKRPNYWYVGAGYSVPFMFGDMSSLTAKRDFWGNKLSLKGGYRFSSLFGLEMGVSAGRMRGFSPRSSEKFRLGTENAMTYYPYTILGGKDNYQPAPDNAGVWENQGNNIYIKSIPYSQLYSESCYWETSLQAVFNFNRLFTRIPEGRELPVSLLVKPGIYLQKFHAQACSLDGHDEVAPQQRPLSIGLGGDLALHFALTQELALELNSGLVWVSKREFDGIRTVRRSHDDFIWQNGVSLIWKFRRNASRPCRMTPMPDMLSGLAGEAEVLPFSDGDFAFGYLTPDLSVRKERSISRQAHLYFVVSRWDIRPELGDNLEELGKITTAFRELADDEDISISSISIDGYASPEGPHDFNILLSQNRARAISSYIARRFDYPESRIHVEGHAEDWDGLVRMLEDERPAYAAKALEVIGKYDNLDVREARLKSALGTAGYRRMMDTYYPRLRRLGVAVDYEVREVANEEAAQLIYTNPRMLSLQEMYRVAKTLRPGTEEYRRVYEIAAQTYPDDVVANINAASANIVSGDFRKAAEYLERVKDDARAWNDLGVLEWLAGNFENARAWFDRAMVAEPEKAKANLEAIKAYEPAAE